MVAENLVLITGVTGHIGFRIFIFALQAGYHVRAAVRSADKADKISSNPTYKALNLPSSVLTFTTVPDLEAPGAYDEAVKGVTHVIHVASPIPSAHLSRSPSEAEEVFIRPAVQGTLAILKAAKKEHSVKRVIITSSMVATMPPKFWGAVVEPPPDTVFTASSRTSQPPAPYPNLQVSYSASKIASLNESEAWIKSEQPQFSVVNVHPGFVIGPDYLRQTTEEMKGGTNMMVLGLALGAKNDQRRVGSAVHVDDVARVHVGALDETKLYLENGAVKSFLTHVPARWEDVMAIVKSEYSDAVEKGILKDDGVQATMPISVDAHDTEEVFGFQFVPFDQQVRSVVGRYVELAASA